ncbi:N-acetylmuramoyl-L-alanine amidase-like domain-containing protein [Aquimarina sp. 2201CG1-2-11]|uniref:N-acetylmuramoyl-L-alanine amidase-like domain-containing protein n=1 Tax=Aquimarina discodermiae TaxID=3231043 RepID=UPI00346297E2
MNFKNLFFFCSLLFSTTVFTQKITCSPKDKEIFSEKIIALQKMNISNNSLGKKIAHIGASFIGTPYVAKTLEINSKERLVINLQGLDCTTFVENVLALGFMLHDQKKDFETYTAFLEKIRYRDGKLNGYASRLHYFSEWISNNEEKKLIKNVTDQIGGQDIDKQINFMSTHRSLYPYLEDDTNYTKIQQSEIKISESPICFLPKNKIVENENLIKTGDIIALTTSINGLDITHTGFALRKESGRIHLLHASSKGQVEISELPLADYLEGIKHNTGIIVSRVRQ